MAVAVKVGDRRLDGPGPGDAHLAKASLAGSISNLQGLLGGPTWESGLCTLTLRTGSASPGRTPQSMDSCLGITDEC